MCIPAATGRPVTWKELKLHATAEDLWVAVNGRAYDLTEYQHLHPGSALILQHVAGNQHVCPTEQLLHEPAYPDDEQVRNPNRTKLYANAQSLGAQCRHRRV